MWKSFHLCFPSNLNKPSSSPSDAAASEDPNRPSILHINNFNLLYDDSAAAGHRICKRLIAPSYTTTTTTFTASTSTAANSSSSSASLDEADNYGFAPEDSPPLDLTAVIASRRFFFSSPGRSNSITDSPDLRRPRFDHKTSTATTSTATRLLAGGAAVKQYVQSPDPYYDFRRSMQEMLDAVTDAEYVRRYEFLHELLLSYLSLNAADTHTFIIRAFADILVSLLSDGHRTN